MFWVCPNLISELKLMWKANKQIMPNFSCWKFSHAKHKNFIEESRKTQRSVYVEKRLLKIWHHDHELWMNGTWAWHMSHRVLNGFSCSTQKKMKR